MATGELPPPTKAQRRHIAAAVDAAEEVTGLQLAVWLGPAEGDSRAAAEAMFVEAGLDQRPGVLLLVAPTARRVEIVTSPTIRDRVPDDAAAAAVRAMVARFKEGDLVGGIDAGLTTIVLAAGPGTPDDGQEELPDVLG